MINFVLLFYDTFLRYTVAIIFMRYLSLGYGSLDRLVHLSAGEEEGDRACLSMIRWPAPAAERLQCSPTCLSQFQKGC